MKAIETLPYIAISFPKSMETSISTKVRKKG